MDEPADPFDSRVPPDALRSLREQFPPETVDAFERFLNETARAGVDYRALDGQPSWRALLVACLTLAEGDPVRMAAILVQAMTRARYASDPDGFSEWFRT